MGRFQRAAEPDLLKQPVGGELPDKLSELLAKLKVTQTAAGPMPALQAVGQLLGRNDGERRIVYLISDFRARQWDRPTQLRTELQQMNEAGAEIHLVNCVDRVRPNLAIATLAPAEGIRAAGVPWFMEVGVQNFGPAPARNVSVILGEDGHGRPSVSLAEIPPGKMVKERFPVHFPTAGRHEITARLESDAVAADNYRYCSIDLPPDAPVLLVDGDAEARDARLSELGAGARRGRADRHSAADRNAPLLEPQAAGRLSGREPDEYRAARRLGGRGFGEVRRRAAAGRCSFSASAREAKYFNDVLYRDGKGLFPVPLAKRAELAIDRLEPAPDVQAEPHFIFRIFAGKRNSFLQTVAVEQYFAVPQGWRPPADSTVRVAASLRNGDPLVVERTFRQGPRGGFPDHRRPDVEQLGPQPELRRGRSGLAGLFVAAVGR